MTELKYILLKWRGSNYTRHDVAPPVPYMIGRNREGAWKNDEAWREIAAFDTKEEAEAMEKLMPEWVPDHLLTPERSEGA